MKLKMSEVDPRGATYSALRYRNASVLPISWLNLRLTSQSVLSNRKKGKRAHMYSNMPSNQSGLSQSFRLDAFGTALVRT